MKNAKAGVRISVYVTQEALVLLRRIAKKRKVSRSKAVVALIHEHEEAKGAKQAAPTVCP